MSFAKKQLEKYGWKEGKGLGKEGNMGMRLALKPKYKTGKEGMGFDLSKELVDTWWTRAYSDSLGRIDVKSKQAEGDEGVEEDISVSVEMTEDSDMADDEMSRMRKRMMRANFTEFSKGATLNNGLMEEEVRADTDHEDSDSGLSTPTSNKQLSDEELFKACGGRTLHKAARFGHKLNGKLARIAAQEAAELLAFQSSITNTQSSITNTRSEDLTESKKSKKSKRKRKHVDSLADNCEAEDIPESSTSDAVLEHDVEIEKGVELMEVEDINHTTVKKAKKRKSKKKARLDNEEV